jgi:ABC-type lipoprotein release transport system permease subunit
MGRLVLVGRLATRDLRRRPGEAALLLMAVTAAATTLTLGLLLHGVTGRPYQQTRSATSGPDVVATVTPVPFNGGHSADLPGLERLARAHGVVGHSGPYPVLESTLRTRRGIAAVQVEGRDRASAQVDQPHLVRGSWVSRRKVVVERSFADAFGVHTGDPISVGDRSFRVGGIAVTAASPPYPSLFCVTPCGLGSAPPEAEAAAHSREPHPGLIWLTRVDSRAVASRSQPLSYVLNLKLAHPGAAPDFVVRNSLDGTAVPSLEAWQDIRQEDAKLVANERRVLLTGSWLLSLLALSSIAVLVGGRMADQKRRVGLLKAIGAAPRTIAAVLLTEYMLLALVAAAAGLVIGSLAAPLLTTPSAGLIGSASSARITALTAEVVIAVSLAVPVIATGVPALRAARISTVRALADSAHPPRRSARLISISARLPIALLLGLRLAARRPRRAMLSVASVAVTVSGIVAVLAAHAQLSAKQGPGSPGLADPRTDRLTHVLLIISVMLVALAAINAIFVAWATVLDARRSSALSRALGATPGQISAGLSAAQVLPAVAGAILGIPGGLALFAAVNSSEMITPPLWSMLATLLAAPLVIAGLTALPARAATRRPVAEVLRSEAA